MDGIGVKEKLTEAIKKYRYALLILLAGILLMTLPEKKVDDSEIYHQESSSEETLQDRLSHLLSKVSGAGNVEVLLTEAEGMQTIFQMDEERVSGETTSDIRRKTVMVTTSDHEEVGLIRRVDPPSYLGAVILCQGADDAMVRLAVVQAVANATGLTTDRISVLKMK